MYPLKCPYPWEFSDRLLHFNFQFICRVRTYTVDHFQPRVWALNVFLTAWKNDPQPSRITVCFPWVNGPKISMHYGLLEDHSLSREWGLEKTNASGGELRTDLKGEGSFHWEMDLRVYVEVVSLFGKKAVSLYCYESCQVVVNACMFYNPLVIGSFAEWGFGCINDKI